MAIEAILSTCSRRTSTTSYASLNLWKTLLPSSRDTAVRVEKQMVETRRHFHHVSRRENHHSSSFFSNASFAFPFSFFRRYYSTSNRNDIEASPTCFNIDKPVTGKVNYSTNGPGANQPMKKLPIGIQSIEKILSKGEYLYVDKTGFAKQLIEGDAPHYFMSRPRRFGKSVFLDTLREILRGNRELFKECQIYNSDYAWQEHPVVYLDFSRIANTTPELLEISLQEALHDVAAL